MMMVHGGNIIPFNNIDDYSEFLKNIDSMIINDLQENITKNKKQIESKEQIVVSNNKEVLKLKMKIESIEKET